MTAPFDVGPMLLLTDGSVLAQNPGTSLWWRLRADRAGRQTGGDWRRTAASPAERQCFASAVLPDGRVLIAGGTSGNDAPSPADLGGAELYDPVSETWAPCPTPDGWRTIGAAPCCVLPDGRLLLGNIQAGASAIRDPATGRWSTTVRTRDAASAGESWTLLPDGSVLAIGRIGGPTARRFAAGVWIDAATPPAALGPALLLTDGSVFAIGATGATAFYTSAGWAAGPPVPGTEAGVAQGATDAPMCLMPNGRVLCAVEPVSPATAIHGPTTIYDVNVRSGRWTAVAELQAAASKLLFLLLPTGEVLVSDQTPSIRVFRPDGAPDPAWAPVIQDLPATAHAGAAARLLGNRLGGLSQACAHGLGAAGATNYPIVRLRGPFPSNGLTYGRTSGHSTMAVATGRALHHTDVFVPADAAPGNYQVELVANGIASPPVPFAILPSRARREPGQDARPGPGSFDEEALFLRDLSEVHLLLDYISGRPEKSLAGLAGAVTLDVDGQPVTSISAQSVIEGICQISYPPDGSIEAKSKQAAYMLTVKDRLNALAAPARGLTVAFTSMFAGTSIDYAAVATPTIPDPREPRFFSARGAFPNLESQARRFHRFYLWQPWIALTVLAVMAYTNWDASVTSAVLNQIDAADWNYASIVASPNGDSTLVARCGFAATPVVRAGTSDECSALQTAIEQRASAYIELYSLLTRRFVMRPVALSVRLFGPTIRKYDRTLAPDHPRNAIARRELHDITVAVVSGLNRIVTPVGFAYLGTIAGLTRSIMAKVGLNVLRPRDHQLARVSIFLGMTAGLAVGLFFDVQTTGADISKSLGMGITVTAAGLSFLAGFGAEAFFSFLDSAVRRLLPP